MKKILTKAQKTKTNIIKSFIQLLNKKEASKISVTNITKEANIDRGTFYRYFANKNELIEHCEDTLTDRLYFTHKDLVNQIKNIKTIPDMKTSYNKLFDIINENLDVINALLNKTGNISFQNKLKNILLEMAYNSLMKIAPNTNQKELIINYVSSSVLGIIKFWSENSDKYDKKEILSFLNIVEIHGLFQFI